MPVVPEGLVLASIGRRVGGILLDQLLVIVPVAIVAVAVGFRPGDELTDDGLLALNLGTAAVSFLYATLMIATLGRTVGKFASGTRVVRSGDGGAPDWMESAQRAIVPVVFSAIPGVGFMLGAFVYGLAFFTPLRQGLHDKAAGTLVVRA